MANWKTITLADLNDTKVAQLIEACRTAALAAGQSDPMPEIIQGVIDRIRVDVAAPEKFVLDADLTLIPKGLHRIGCRMVVREMQSRLQEPLLQDERTEQQNDLDYLAEVRKGKIPIATPITPEAEPEVQTGGAVRIVSTGCAKVSRQNLDGL
jgi:hypothetical protein